MAYHVTKVDMPHNLVGIRNGEVPLDRLVTVPGGTMHHLAADAWLAMCAAALAEQGIVLSPSSGYDTYRTYDMQVTGFVSHYTKTFLSGRPTKRWKGETWYLNPGFYPAAEPGKSNHGWGLAVDIANFGLGGTPTPKVTWVLDNYERFGFSHEYDDQTTDPPHIRYHRGDDVPPAVREFTGRRIRGSSRRGRGIRIPLFDPEFGQFSLWPLAENKPRLKVGATGDPVRYAQGVFRSKLGYATEVNGDFDETFRLFVVWFQAENRLDPDGMIGKDTWPVIYAVALGSSLPTPRPRRRAPHR